MISKATIAPVNETHSQRIKIAGMKRGSGRGLRQTVSLPETRSMKASR